MISRTEATDQFYVHLEELATRIGGPKQLTDPRLSRRCPSAGLYFFFETGEVRPNDRPRVVRVGTHALTASSKTTLWGRLRQHRGTLMGLTQAVGTTVARFSGDTWAKHS